MNKIIIANWKMNVSNLTDWSNLKKPEGVEIVICPPFTHIEKLAKFLKENNVKLGAQNCFYEQKGAYTGEISPIMLKNLGVEYVIIGHSERRNYLKETDEMINKKVLAALKAGLKIVLCVGETLEQREKGLVKEVIENQLEKDLKVIQDSFIVAYEPVWAIGTGNYCQPEDALEMIKFIKNIVNFKVIYGGSVDSKNIAGYVKYPEIDGALVGGASLKIDEFKKIINEVSKTIKS
jgi:triosephosphate isomerase